MGIFQSIGKGIIKVAVVPTGNAISNLIKKGSGTATYENTFATSKAGQVYTSVLGASALATAIAVPSSLKAKAVATASTIIVGSASQSDKVSQSITKGVVNLPKNLSNVGTNIGNVIEDPTLANAKDLIVENPGIVIGGTILGLGAGALGIGSLLSGIENRNATNKNTQAIEDQTKNAIIPITSKDLPKGETISTTPGQTINIINQLPSTEATAVTSAPGTSKTSTKKKTTTKKPVKKKKTTHKYKSRKKVNGKWVYKY
jgi:hypothetical protein